MANIFHPSTNTISKLSIVGALLAVPTLGVATYAFNMSYMINLKVPLEQPVQFSHKHHVGDDGIDCRYCHTSVDKSSFAGIPPVQTCMTCHSQIWTDSPQLEPIRESFRTGRPIRWARVHDLPDFVFFNHSIHLKKGVSCVKCHGRIDQMPLTWKQNTLSMSWCIECHRNPAKNLRPHEHLYEMAWQPSTAEEQPRLVSGGERPTPRNLGRDRVVQAGKDTYHLLSEFQMTNCSTCHH
jgi:Cytochrome c7 and related cytochrome c/Class III cytochrome C family